MFDYIYVDDKLSTNTIFNPIGRDLFYEATSALPSGYLDILKDHYNSNNNLLPKYAGFTAKDNFLYPLLTEFRVRTTKSFIDLTKKKFTPSFAVEDLNDFYPIAVRYTDNKNTWLIERPPFKATVSFKNTRSASISKKEYTFDIWVPWSLMFLHAVPEESYYNAYLYFNDGPLTSKDDLFIPCMYPNMYTDGRMCLNETGVLLQQHLSSIQKFDISTIYNFLINDYMSGGWNTDLGVGFFQSNVSRLNKTDSPSAYKAYNIILHGDSTKKHPSSFTSSGRITYNKYTLNFLKYFSTLTLEEVTSIVTEFKNGENVNRFSLNSIVDKDIFSSYRKTHYSQILFPSDFRTESYINTKYMTLIDYDFAVSLSNGSDESIQNAKKIITQINDLLVADNSQSINKLIDSSFDEDDPYAMYVDFRGYKENDCIIITPDNVQLVSMKLPSDFYTSTFPKLNFASEPANAQ